MTEAEWLTSQSPTPLLEYMRGKASARKFLLYACACLRDVWPLLEDEMGLRYRKAVEVAEGYVDGVGNLDAYRGSFMWVDREFYPDPADAADVAASDAADCSGTEAERIVAGGFYAGWDDRRPKQASQLRDIMGNPYRQIVIDSAWRTCTVLALAEGIYTERAFDRLPILADALEEAGCTEADFLNHCRQPGDHARGCWVVDLILGKK